jgi:hypothetical protein
MKPFELLGLFASIERNQTHDFPKGGHGTQSVSYADDTPRELRLTLAAHGIAINATIGDGMRREADYQRFTLLLSWETWTGLMSQFHQEAQKLATTELQADET